MENNNSQKPAAEPKPHKKTVWAIWIVIIVLLVVAAVIGVMLITGRWGGTDLFKSAKKAEEELPKITPSKTESQPIVGEEKETKEYRDDKVGVTIAYPKEWQEFARHEGLVDAGEAYQITNDQLTVTAATADVGEMGHGGATLYIVKRLDPAASTEQLAADLKDSGYTVLDTQKISAEIVRLYCLVGSESGWTLVTYWWRSLPQTSKFTGLWIAGPMIEVVEFAEQSPPEEMLSEENAVAAANKVLQAGIPSTVASQIAEDEEVVKSITVR